LSPAARNVIGDRADERTAKAGWGAGLSIAQRVVLQLLIQHEDGEWGTRDPGRGGCLSPFIQPSTRLCHKSPLSAARAERPLCCGRPSRRENGRAIAGAEPPPFLIATIIDRCGAKPPD